MIKVSKKVKMLFAVTVSLLITSVSAFGMYGVDGDDWINFLVHGNQFRARMDQLGFVLGNGTIKGTLGFRADTSAMGDILSKGTRGSGHTFNPTVSAGIGYTSDMIGIGVGYNFTYVDKYMQVHTPVVVLNALNNNLRLAIPIQVGVADIDELGGKNKYTTVGFNALELRYLTGIDAFNQIRVYAYYKNQTWDAEAAGVKTKSVYEDFNLQVRLYFLRTQIGDVTVNPYVRIEYGQVIKGIEFERNYTTVGNNYRGANYLPVDIAGVSTKQSDIYDVSPFRVFVKPVLSLAASSDTVSLYFEPSLGYIVTSRKAKGQDQVTTHALNWGAYAELYVTPVKDLEWYFEMDVNGNVGANSVSAKDLPPVYFETTTGITWYLPSLGGNQ